MLAKRARPKLRTDGPKCEWPRHRKFVRGHTCIVPGCADGPIEACHVRKGLPSNTPDFARGGVGKKPHDCFVFPACSKHHKSQHAIGELSFAALHRINLLREALDLARRSPCEEVRMFLKEYGL